MTVDLGTVSSGEAATKTVFFSNSGSEPLDVTQVKSSCGCTTIQGARQTLAPGEQGSFELKLDTGGLTGNVAKTVDVESNAASGMARLTLKASVWSPVALNPPKVSFGVVLKGTKIKPRRVEITVTDPEPLKIAAISCSNPYFQTELKTLEEGRRYQLTISVPETGDQLQTSEMVLELGHSKMRELKLPLFVYPVDPIVVEPAEIILSTETLDTSLSPSIFVICHDPALASFEITDPAFSAGGEVTVSIERQATNKWGRIHVSFPTGFDPEIARGAHVTFRTNHPRYPQVEVPVIIENSSPVFIPPASDR